MTVKRAALLLSISYVVGTAGTLSWQLRALLRPTWPPFGTLLFSGWWSVIFGSLVTLSWAAYFACIYRERSHRRNPVSLWAITLWTAAVMTMAAVSSAVQSWLYMAANREALATGMTTWARSVSWRFGTSYTTSALWITLVVFLAHDPRGQRTRWIAALLSAVALLTGGFDSYRLVLGEVQWWEQVFFRSWRAYPLTALWTLALAPSMIVFGHVCTVLFPCAVWKEIGPRVPHADAAPEQPAVE